MNVDEGGMAIGTPFEETEAKLGLPSTCVLTAAAKCTVYSLALVRFWKVRSGRSVTLPSQMRASTRCADDQTWMLCR